MRKVPEQENLMIKVRVHILWENARVYNREEITKLEECLHYRKRNKDDKEL